MIDNAVSALLWRCWEHHTHIFGFIPTSGPFCLSGIPDLFDRLRPVASRLCPPRMTVHPSPAVGFIQGAVVMHLGYVLCHPTWLITIKPP